MKSNFEKFKEQYGPYALIAGASQGIGEAFALELARRGVNLILLARRETLLKDICKSLEENYNIEAIPLVADLTSSNLLEEFEPSLNDREVNLLVYNAALSPIGPFLNTSREEHEKVISLNCRGPMLLSHYFGTKMKSRGRGGIILMSSLAGFQGSPVVAHYSATKSYNTILAEALWEEFKPYGINVKACVAGATTTPNYLDSKPKEVKGISPPLMEPMDVAKEALKKIDKNKPYIIVGMANRFSSFLMRRILSTKKAIKTIEKFNMKMYGE